MVHLTLSRFLKISPAIKELRLHLCQFGKSSEGVRNFIEKQYVGIKKENPGFPILVRECSGIEPKLWIRYDLGKEKCVSLSCLNECDVLKQFESAASGK